MRKNKLYVYVDESHKSSVNDNKYYNAKTCSLLCHSTFLSSRSETPFGVAYGQVV